MADLSGFDANEVPPTESRDVLPAGDYEAVIVESEMKPTKDGSGKRLALTLQVLSGQYQNRKVFDNLNLVNNGPNKQTTEKIAKGTLSAICRAVNVLTPGDSSELHNKPLRIKVVVKAADGNYSARNEIKGYMPRSSGPASAGTFQQPAQPAPSTGGGFAGKSPW